MAATKGKTVWFGMKLSPQQKENMYENFFPR